MKKCFGIEYACGGEESKQMNCRDDSVHTRMWRWRQWSDVIKCDRNGQDCVVVGEDGFTSDGRKV